MPRSMRSPMSWWVEPYLPWSPMVWYASSNAGGAMLVNEDASHEHRTRGAHLDTTLALDNRDSFYQLDHNGRRPAFRHPEFHPHRLCGGNNAARYQRHPSGRLLRHLLADAHRNRLLATVHPCSSGPVETLDGASGLLRVRYGSR